MATTQKKQGSSGGGKSTGKSGGARVAGHSSQGGSRASNSGGSRAKQSSASRSGGKGNGSRSLKTERRSYTREVGGIICLLLTILTACGYFPVDAIVINGIRSLLKGLLGYGFFAMPPALLAAGLFLLLHRGKPVRLRVVCVLLLPVALGAILHLFLGSTYEVALDLVPALWSDGQLAESGGVISGGLAFGMVALLSKVPTAIILIAAFIVLAFIAARLTPWQLREMIREYRESRWEYEDEEEEEPKEAAPVQEKTPAKEPEAPPMVAIPRPQRHRSRIDIPLDEEKAPFGGDPAEAIKPEQPKPVRFNKKPGVPAPDELLGGPGVEVPVEELAPEQLKKEKVSAEDAAVAAAEISKDIQENLAAEPQAYRYPPLDLLEAASGGSNPDARREVQFKADRLSETISSFGIDAKISNVVSGPTVTRYEFELDRGVRLNKLTNLAEDIALSLGASGVRIAPVPDKSSMVGIEVPNRAVTPVPIREVLESRAFQTHASRVAFAVGKDISNNCVVGNAEKLPHLLIAGTTGSGKSVCTNSLIVSMLYKSTPEEVRFIMVDPKMVELAPYNGIPHLLIPVVTDPKKAAGALQWAVYEMMKRYKSFSEVGVKKLEEYNALAGVRDGVAKMPTVVVVIDELADLMLVAAKEVEESICRVAQMGRAAGIHLVIATQRPSADVITGLMKANIPSRIAFAVASSLESRIILDTPGAEKLVSRGDMLYAPLGAGKPQRIQGCFISPEEIERVVEFVKASGEANYSEEVISQIEAHLKEKEKGSKDSSGGSGAAGEDDGDELLPNAVEVVLETGQASVSMLQRRLKLGYSRAARLVDQMEERGIVGPFEGSKPRQLLITREQWQELQMRRDQMDLPVDLPETGEVFLEDDSEEEF